MADLSITTVVLSAASNGVVSGLSFYLLEDRFSGYSTWQKAALASATGTVTIALVLILLNSGR